MNLSRARKRINNLLTELDLADKTQQKQRKKLTGLEDYFTYTEEARKIAQQVGQHIQQMAHKQIANVVTSCLQMVFEDDYGFKIDFVLKRGKTEAKLLLLKDGHEIENPIDEDSGGVLDVAAFALRVACIVLFKPPQRRLLVMDEPFKFVSTEFRDNIRMMIEKLAEDFDFQFIMITHIEALKTGKVIRL